MIAAYAVQGVLVLGFPVLCAAVAIGYTCAGIRWLIRRRTA